MPRARPPRPLLHHVVGVVALAIVIGLSGCGGSASSGHSSRGLMESIFQDDQFLLYSPAKTVAKTLDTLRSLGVDRVRVTVLWAAIAPEALSRKRPKGFDAADPSAYPATGWGPWDRLVALARRRGIAVAFNVTAPGPLWAMDPGGGQSKYANHYRPSATDFGQFVAAVGKRYGGRYKPPGGSSPLPRVSYWTIWNEPNQPGWLAPQWRKAGGKPVMSSPALYRAYADAAFAALRRTGHGPESDTILIGELAPEGTESTVVEAPIPPMPFLRGLYCVDSAGRPLRGGAAAALQCPTGGTAAGFARRHPALFQSTGFAHHPYSFFLAPTASMSDQNFVPLSDLGRLERGLDQIFAAYGVHRQLPIYLTEYGYETNPPNPYRGVSLQKQAAYIDEAQYMASKDPRVRAMTQFLLVDSAPNSSFPKGSIGYWSTFQTGLEFLNHTRKPSYVAYRLPLVIPAARFSHGGSLLVWGMLRAAPNDTRQDARIQWRSGGGSYRTLASVSTNDPSGFLTAHVKPPGSGSIRLEWVAPGGATIHSRTVAVTQSG